MDSISFIHTADFHFGADFRRFGQSAAALETAQYQALRSTLQIAENKNVAFVLVCGDLFDSRFPSDATVQRVSEILGSFESVRVFILPGTHDFLSDDSILSAENSRWAPVNTVIFNEHLQSPYYLPESDLYLYFNPNRSNRSASSPIAGFAGKDTEGYHIGMAHGSIELAGLDIGYDFPISSAEIEDSRLDYIALGHWHRPNKVEFSDVVAAYPGIPQPLSFSDPAQGFINHVTLYPKKSVNLLPIKTSSVLFDQLYETIYHPYDLEKLLEIKAGCDKILKLNLNFSDNFKEYPEIDRIIDNFKSRFLFVDTGQAKHKGSDSKLSQPGDGKPNLLIERYLEEIRRLRAEDSDERVSLYEKAAELGARIIKGEVK